MSCQSSPQTLSSNDETEPDGLSHADRDRNVLMSQEEGGEISKTCSEHCVLQHIVGGPVIIVIYCFRAQYALFAWT